jgi:tetrahydromethanopterin S-methyltransferase subunit A
MKRLSVVLLLLGLAGCNYPSSEQARGACEDWADKNREVTFVEVIPAEDISRLEKKIQDLKDWRNNSSNKEWMYSIEELIEKKREEAKEKTITHEVTARWCFEEEKTNQFLGYENLRATNGTWENKEGMMLDEKIVKHFRY